MFINREKELIHLNEEYEKDSARFVVLYGRRRVGKTALIEEFLKGKEYIYYLADQQIEQQQIEDFKRRFFEYTKDEFLLKTKFEDWDHFFSYLVKIFPKDKRVVLAIDEFTYLIKSNKALPSILQKYWDTFFSKTKVFLLVSGSLVGLMLKRVLNYDSPLYGRRTSQMHLQPFNFKLASKFIKKFSIEDRVILYSITGGVAKYLLMVEEKAVEDFMRKKFLEKDGFFYQEGIILLSQEFKNPAVYMSVLKAIALGNTKLNEISNYVGIDGRKLSKYLDVLVVMGMVEREAPVTEDPLRFRGSIYKINDNFLKFWFRFILPNKSDIELGKIEEPLRDIIQALTSYTSHTFEDICREFLAERKPFPFKKLGRWWHKGEEIDIVALNEVSKEIAFFECKWGNVGKRDAERILGELRRKAELVQWHNAERKERYGIIAKRLAGKEELRRASYLAYDLDDLGRQFR